MAKFDYAHNWTDEQLKQLEDRITREYVQAAREMHAKQRKALERYSKERTERLKALDDTPEARREYKRWLQSQAVNQERMQSMVTQLSDSAVRANERASEMARNILPSIYTENANRAAFSIDKAVKADTRFSLVDEDTVRRLMGLGEHGQLIHEVIDMGPARERIQSLSKTFPKTNEARDILWNRQKFTSAITQGILQGESIPNIIKRTDSIFGSNRAAAIRAARTACTSAENAGRVASYERAESLGINLVQEWMATLDERTRESHRMADGQQVEVGESFKVGDEELEYPGDPAGDPSETYNCRCTLRAMVKGFEDGEEERWSRLPDDITYEEWKEGKPLSLDESYENEAGIVSPQWLSDNKAEDSFADIDDIGTRPVRPSRDDFETQEAYEAARAEYREERAAFNERRDSLVDEIAAMPGHGYETEQAAREWAESRGAVIADEVFANVDARALDEAIDVTERLMQKYPEVFEPFELFGQKFTIGTAENCFMEANGGLAFNPTYFGSYRDAIGFAVDGYTESLMNDFVNRELRGLVRGEGTLRTSVTHEFGHNIDGTIRWRRFYGVDEVKDADALRRYESELMELTRTHTTSSYALTNTAEAFAEGFAEMECNPTSQYAKAFAGFLGRWL